MATSLTLTDLLQFDEIDKHGATCIDKLQQAGNIDNLQQVCGVFACLQELSIPSLQCRENSLYRKSTQYDRRTYPKLYSGEGDK